ncbi:MAG: hypothetical protein ACRDPC_02590 [Solirubrobacteraceae bacterium]
MATERVLVVEVTVRVFDCGPEPEFHKDRSLFGPWWRYEAELVGEGVESERGCTPADAIYRLVGFNRPRFLRRWPAKEADER